MNRQLVLGAAWTVVLACVLLSTGCTYMSHRGHDALRIMDIGITTSSHPYFAFYPGDYFNSTPMGYSSVHGNYYGWAHGQFGKLKFDDESWGVILWGSSQLQIGDLNVNDNQQFSPNRLAALKAAGDPIPMSSPRYNTGPLRMAMHDNTPPPRSFLACCRRNFHFGWVGIHLALHLSCLADFMIGWTGYDLMGDDNLPPPLTAEEAAAGGKAVPAEAPAAPPVK